MVASVLALMCVDMADDRARNEAVLFLSRGLGGLPTMAMIRATPSADLQASLGSALEAAMSKGLSTSLVVNLMDLVLLKVSAVL